MDVTLVCFRDGPFAREAAELGIDTRVFDGGFFSALRQVKKLIAEEGFELVHTHGSRANLAGAILRSGCGRPVVSTVHSDYRLDYMGRPLAGATYGVLNVLALRRIKYHVGVSDAMRQLLISRGFPRETTFAIYNGLDFTREDVYKRQAEAYEVLPARLAQRLKDQAAVRGVLELQERALHRLLLRRARHVYRLHRPRVQAGVVHLSLIHISMLIFSHRL